MQINTHKENFKKVMILTCVYTCQQLDQGYEQQIIKEDLLTFRRLQVFKTEDGWKHYFWKILLYLTQIKTAMRRSQEMTGDYYPSETLHFPQVKIQKFRVQGCWILTQYLQHFVSWTLHALVSLFCLAYTMYNG